MVKALASVEADLFAAKPGLYAAYHTITAAAQRDQ
jgi:hypothetical protein